VFADPGRIRASLSLEPEFRRSHGSLYKSLTEGDVAEGRLRELLVEHRPKDWPLVFAVDASTWDRRDAECSPERGFHYWLFGSERGVVSLKDPRNRAGALRI
jgi:hypothetical protein